MALTPTPADPNLTALTGMFKQVYADKYRDLVPGSVKLLPMVPFDRKAMLGDKYHQMVVVADEGGFTYSVSGQGPVTIGPMTTMQSQDVQVNGFQLILQTTLDYEAAAKAQNSKQAFTDAIGLKMKNMLVSAKKRIECSLIYGQSGLGKVQTAVTASTTSSVVTITAATHAPLIWAGKTGHKVVFYSGTTQLGSSDGTFAIDTVNVSDSVRTITVTGSANDIQTFVTGAVGSDIFWNTSRQGSTSNLTEHDMQGIDSQITQTTGLKFNVDVAKYDLWRGNTFDLGSAAVNDKAIFEAASVAVNRGLDGDVTLFLHPRAWENLNASQTAKRVFDKSYSPKDGKNGFQVLEYHYQAGVIKVIGHGGIKAGEGFMLPDDELMRIGAYDLSFVGPGQGEQIFFHNPTATAYNWRLYSHQSILLTAPAKSVKLTGIVND